MAVSASHSGGSKFGARPRNYLYGMTSAGGVSNVGVVFRMNTNGTEFEVLHGFLGGTGDGRSPQSGALVTADGVSFYGVTYYGGANDLGVLFKLEKLTPAEGAMVRIR
jgi:uncharacterized repeat protein (TIGR03803 family)